MSGTDRSNPERARQRPRRALAITTCALALVMLLVACRDQGQGADWGKVFNWGRKAVRTGRKIAKAFEATHLTPAQEHYVGRAVAAQILAAYRPYDNSGANRYINLLGQTLARASDRPDTFMGYRFLILDTDEVNSFAAPGGFIFITRGMLRCCDCEDGVAAVLAHEIAHVQWKHGLRSIRAKRLTAVGSLLLGEATTRIGSGEFRQITRAFGGSVDDVANQLIRSKYSRATEVIADQTAVDILTRLGYDVEAFKRVLQAMQQRFRSDRRGFYNSHPAPAFRLRVIEKRALRNRAAARSPAARRQARFHAALAGV